MVFKSLKDAFGPKKPPVNMTEDYRKWREMVFAMPPEQVGASKSDADRVYGVILDLGQFDRQSGTRWAISLSAFPSGEASFRPSPGGGALSLGDDPKVAQAAQEIVQIAQTLLPQTQPAQDLSLPGPGFAQFVFLTTRGVHGFKEPVDNIQTPGHPFAPLLERFGMIRQFADQILDNNRDAAVKALYILAFTPETMDQNMLIGVSQMAANMLKAKEPIFKERMEKSDDSTLININQTKYIPSAHNPTTMQTLMMDWLNKQYNITFRPTPGNNLFLQGVRDPQAREHIFLFYFDLG